jgi:hypothetical protein
LNNELRAFMKKLKTISAKKDQDKIKIKMMDITDEMEDLR